MRRHAMMFMLIVAFAAGPALGQEPTHNGKLFCPVVRWAPLHFPGVVQELLVTPGSQVRQGDVLVRYVLKEEAALALQNEVTAGARTHDLRLRLLEIERELLELGEKLTASRRLSDARLGPEDSARRLSAGVDLLSRQKLLLTNLVQEKEAAFRGRLAELEHQLGAAVDKGRLPTVFSLKAPITGQVLLVDKGLRPGNAFQPTPNAVSIGSMDPMLIRSLVFEGEVAGLRVGGKARVSVPSLGNKEVEAVIVHIDQSPQDVALDRPTYYGVELKVPNPDASLRQGFKCVITFLHATPPRLPGREGAVK
jgi:multidrug efflux pump subunit AcrA (membrane-fusion protein)